jgi:hypothetical protein
MYFWRKIIWGFLGIFFYKSGFISKSSVATLPVSIQKIYCGLNGAPVRTNQKRATVSVSVKVQLWLGLGLGLGLGG